MRVACVYTVERRASSARPLQCATDIPFGISIIATLLETAGHDVDLFVFAAGDDYEGALADYVRAHRPGLVCLTSVSTQFHFVQHIADAVKRIDSSVFVVLGGHHASLDSEAAITSPSLDALCVGEGDACAVELARRIEDGTSLSGIPSLWLKSPDGTVEKTPPSTFLQDLDALPFINRRMWDPWIEEPDRFPSVLLGRGCPFRCTYCSNHAMQRLSSGRFVRFRSPESIVGEIEQICFHHPGVDTIYLEVETIAHQKQAYPLFEALAAFNRVRDKKIAFGLNFTITSVFVRDRDKCREFLDALRNAHVTYLNIGLESGSEALRKEVLRRPKYTNREFIDFSRLAHEYSLDLDLYVLVGVPGETPEHHADTVRLVRAVRPKMVFLSIFYPYVGTDLATVALREGLVSKASLDPTAERARAALDLPDFSRARVRLAYVLFWFRAFHGIWPMRRILAQTARGAINGSPRLWGLYRRLRETRVYQEIREVYHRRVRARDKWEEFHRATQFELTYFN